MSYFSNNFTAILVKDIITELRAKQLLPTMIVLAMLIIWIMRIVAEAASINPAAAAPAALWIALLFAGLLAQERSFEAETRQDCIAALLLAPVDPGTIYFAKFCVNLIMLGIFEIVIVPLLLFVFDVAPAGRWIELITVLVLGNIAISAIGTLFSAIVQLSRSPGPLLSILVFAILMPLIIPAASAILLLFADATEKLPAGGTVTFVGNFKTAVGYMLSFDALFTVVSWLLFPFVVRDWHS